MNSLLVALSIIAGGSCSGPDAESARLIRAVSGWAAAGDSIFKAVDSADIVLETDEGLCSRLTEAYAKLPGEVDTPGSLYVVRVGTTHYAILDPNDMSGPSRTVMIFDAALRLKGSKQHLQASGGQASGARLFKALRTAH